MELVKVVHIKKKKKVRAVMNSGVDCVVLVIKEK